VTTHEVVQRVLPLLERLSPRSVDKARLLQYLSARAAADWGVFQLLREEHRGDERTLIYRDRVSQEERRIRYPECLPADLEGDVVAEYKRLAMARPLTTMDPRLFEVFFRSVACDTCTYDAAATRQICRECHFAGYPINYLAH
jgi:hypothetical protein